MVISRRFFDKLSSFEPPMTTKTMNHTQDNPLAISPELLQQARDKEGNSSAQVTGQTLLARAQLWPRWSNPDGKRIIRRICSAIRARGQMPSDQTHEAWAGEVPSVVISRFWRRRLLCHILHQNQPSYIFIQLQQQGLLSFLIPELARAYGVAQNHYHAYDVFYHSIYACDNIPPDKAVLRLATLFHDLGKVDTRRWSHGEYTFHNHEMAGARLAVRFCRALACPPEVSQKVRRLIRNHMFHYSPEWNDSAVRRFYRNIGGDLINDLFLLRLADRKANGKREGIPGILFQFRDRIEALLQKDQEFAIKDLEIDGHILMEELGLKPGPTLGRVLEHLYKEVKDNRLANEPSRLIEEAEAFLSAKQ
jgi:putative nucleotidyltransferase with HDIG domain